jgi:type IV pilus assembly protein PilC
MLFQYTAKTAAGATSSGVLEADSPTLLRQMLREKGLFALSMKPAGKSDASPGGSGGFRFGLSKVSKRDLLMFTTQLVILSRSGVELAEALQISRNQATNPKLRVALEKVYNDLSDGMSVSAALRRQSHIFGDAYVAGVTAGEASGQIPEVLNRLSEMLRNEIRLQSTLKAALSYPVILMGVSLLVVAALLGFVLPQFSSVFATMEVPMPASTQILLGFSSGFQEHAWLYSGAILAAITALVRLWPSPAFRRYRDKLALNLFVVKEVTRSLNVGRSFRLLGTMLQSGVPLLEGLQLCGRTLQNSVYRGLFEHLQQEVLNGRGIGVTLAGTPYVPAGAAQMVLTAERAGRLGNVLQMVGEYYEDDGERRLQELARMLEPAVIVLMGAIVAFIVASVMLPMLDISTVG